MSTILICAGRTYFWPVAQEVAKQLQAEAIVEGNGYTFHPTPDEGRQFGRVAVYNTEGFVGYL